MLQLPAAEFINLAILHACVLTMCCAATGEGETVLRARFKAVNAELVERFRALEEEFR
jgi:hypothetical protein